jgi:ABC-type glutathione transport system ATPase component
LDAKKEIPYGEIRSSKMIMHGKLSDKKHFMTRCIILNKINESGLVTKEGLNLISVRKLSYIYKSPKEEIKALDNVNLEIKKESGWL